MIKNFRFYLFIALIVSGEIFAQGGSLYSRYGVGDLFYNYSARGFGMGAVGTALARDNYLSLFNPAGWNKLQMTYFETGAYFKGLNIKDQNYASSFGDYKFSGFLFGFPVSKAFGISLVGGIVPYSITQYSVYEPVKNSQVGDYLVKYTGDGSISKMFVGTSFRLPFGMSIGADFEYFTGKIGHQSKFEFDATSTFENSVLRRELNYHGIGTTIGAISPNFSFLLLNFVDDVRIGATLQIINQLPTDKLLIGISSTGTKEYDAEIVKTYIPPRASIGASFRIKRFTLLADYVMQQWSKYEFNGKVVGEMRDSHRLGAGFEYDAPRGRLKTFWEQISFRGGVSYEQTRNSFNGIGIDEYAASLGFSLPFQLTNTVDVGIRAGIRGTQDFNLVQEKFISAGVTINLGELWFLREDR